MPPKHKLEFTAPVSGREEAFRVLNKVAVNWESRQSAVEAVAESGLLLSRAPEALRGDRGVVMAAVRNHGLALHYASEELRDDRGVVEAALAETGLALEHASLRLQADKELVLKAVAQNGAALEYATLELRVDPAFVLKAVERSARALSFAADCLLKDEAFVTEAVKRNSWALGYSPKHLHRDRALVLDRWHEPPKPHEPPPSTLPGKHRPQLLLPQWQGDALTKRSRPRSQPPLEATMLPESQNEADVFAFPGFELPLELELARQQAAKKAGIFRGPGATRGLDADLFQRAKLGTRESDTLPAELEAARQQACHKMSNPRTCPPLPAELELARQAGLRKGLMTR